MRGCGRQSRVRPGYQPGGGCGRHSNWQLIGLKMMRATRSLRSEAGPFLNRGHDYQLKSWRASLSLTSPLPRGMQMATHKGERDGKFLFILG